MTRTTFISWKEAQWPQQATTLFGAVARSHLSRREDYIMAKKTKSKKPKAAADVSELDSIFADLAKVKKSESKKDKKDKKDKEPRKTPKPKIKKSYDEDMNLASPEGRRYTEDGLPIYTEEELRIGKSGNIFASCDN